MIESQRMRWAMHVARIGGINSYEIVIGMPESKSPFGRPKRRWEDDIKMHLEGIRWEVVDRLYVSQDRDQLWALANTVMNLRFPLKAGNFLTS
jgi:hypothetical protein